MPPAIALLAISFSLGIAAREATGLGIGTSVAIAAVSSLSLVVAWRLRSRFGLLSVVNAFALGLVAAAGAWPRAPIGVVDGGAWEIAGRVVETPDRGFGRTHALVAIETLARDGRERTAGGVRVQVAIEGDPVEPLLPGDLVRFRAHLSAPRGFVESDSPDPARRAAERHLAFACGVADAASLARVIGERGDAPSPTAALRRRIAALRAFLLGRIAAHLEGERRALVESLVLGERAGIPRPLDDAFRAAGVNHVLSVSGLHLAIAAFLFFVGLRRLLVRVTPLARRFAAARLAAACALPATLFYALLTGGAVATMRSLAASWVFLLGVALVRPAGAAAAFSVAALVLLGDSPLALYDPSFQLSFAAALGASLLAPPMNAALRRGCLDGTSRLAGVARFFVGLVVTSAAAILATAPLTAWHFAQVAPAGLVANVVVVPLAELWVLPVGLVGCAFAPILDGAAGLLFRLAGVGAAGMAAAVRWFASVFPAGKVPAPSFAEALLWYVLLAALLLYWHHRHRAAGPIAAACAAAFLACISLRVLRPRLFPSLMMTFLDIGQGDACFVELPGGRTLLVDGGGSWSDRFDPGAQVIVPWLERRGVRRIDYVVLTHPHPDHAGGLASVVARIPTGEVWTSGVASSLPALARLEAAASARGVPVVRPHALDVLDGAASVRVLSPLVGGAVRVPQSFSENDGSIVLRLAFAGRAALLTGDIERRAEWRLTAESGDAAALAADVVKAPHHGSRTSSTPALVEAAHASVVVFSVGAGNRWNFPADAVVDRWRAAGARTFRTDDDGAVTVTIDRKGRIDVATARH